MTALRQKITTLYWSSVPGPLGICHLLATEVGICWMGTPGTAKDVGLAWVKRRLEFEQVVEGDGCLPLRQATDELRRYFAGDAVCFTCPLDLHGTPFQKTVWQALCDIPYGETRSYGELAHTIGLPTASRAVGAANGANPVAIIVPCHRVIGSNGLLTGYGGGLPTKSWLLALEGVSHRQHPRVARPRR